MIQLQIKLFDNMSIPSFPTKKAFLSNSATIEDATSADDAFQEVVAKEKVSPEVVKPNPILEVKKVVKFEIESKATREEATSADDALEDVVTVEKVSLEKVQPNPILDVKKVAEVEVKSKATSSRKLSNIIKKLKLTKDPDAPKAPPGAYIRFAMQQRPIILNELGNLGLSDIGKETGRRWAALDGDTKAKLVKEAKEDREKFKKATETYKASETYKAKTSTPESKADFKNKKPKKEVTKNTANPAEIPSIAGPTSDPVADYFAFLFSNWSQVRQQHPQDSPKVIQDILWKQWSSGEQEEEAPPPAKKQKKIRDPLAPKRPVSAYLLFANSIREAVKVEQPELSSKEMVTELARRWGFLVEEEKASFKVQADQLMVEYREKLVLFKNKI